MTQSISLGVGTTVYYHDSRTGRWESSTIGAIFDDGYGLNNGGVIEKSVVITEEEARRQGVHKTSTPADRARYLESLYATFKQVRSGNAVVDAIVDEHNRIRRNPKAYAAELRAARTALLQPYTVGVSNSERVKVAERAVDTAIQDLEALEQLPPLVYSPEGSKVALEAAQRNQGQHSNMNQMVAAWHAYGFPKNIGAAESITSLPETGSDEEKGKAVVRGLFIDWGEHNAGQYGHRASIIDGRLVSVARRLYNAYATLGVGITESGTVYIQYLAAQK
jgi:hypothetical protein